MKNNWTLQILAQDKDGVRFKIEENNKLLSFKEVFEHWKNTPAFIQFYVNALIAFPYEEFFWEHPAVKTAYLDRPYETILLKSSSFKNRKVDERSFKEKIETEALIAVFPNLGKNATLVVPTKHHSPAIYKHLGSFLRAASSLQVQAIFQQLGETLLAEITKGKLVWLNTAGLGVIWLHIRLDSRPKYYKVATYKKPDFLERKK